MNEETKKARESIGAMLPDEKNWISMVEEISLLGVARAICDDGPRAGMAHTVELVSAAGLALGALCGSDDDGKDEVAEIFANAVREGVKQRERVMDGAAHQAFMWAKKNAATDTLKAAAASGLAAMRRKAH